MEDLRGRRRGREDKKREKGEKARMREGALFCNNAKNCIYNANMSA